MVELIVLRQVALVFGIKTVILIEVYVIGRAIFRDWRLPSV